MNYSKKSNQKASPKRNAVSTNPRGVVGQKKVPAGTGPGPIAGGRHSAMTSPKADARKGDKSISKQVTKSVIGIGKSALLFLIFFFTFFALMLKTVMAVLVTIGVAVLNFFGIIFKKKWKRFAGINSSFLNYLDKLDMSYFVIGFSQRKAHYVVPVFIKQNSRFKGFSTTTKYFVMMGLPNPDASVEAYLLIPANHGKAVTKMNDIIASCTGNIYVPLLVIDLDAASALVDLFNKAHGAARKKTLGDAVAALEVFMAKFQTCSELPANKDNSIVILQSGGFHVKGVGGGHPSTWDAFRGKLAGEVDMTFITGAGTCCYDPWYSLDGLIWVRMDPTIYNHATLTGMVPGSWIWVRYQLFDAHGAEGFHPAIPVQVQS